MNELSLDELQARYFDPEQAAFNRTLYVNDDYVAAPEQIAAAQAILAYRRTHYGWRDVSGTARADLLSKFEIPDGGEQILEKPLPFYAHPAGDSRLIHVRAASGKPEDARRAVLLGGDDLLYLDGNSPCIHKMNLKMREHAPAAVSDDRRGGVEEYLQFFCEHIHSKEWAFHLIEEEGPGHPLTVTTRDQRRDLRAGRGEVPQGSPDIVLAFPITQIPNPFAGIDGWVFLATVVHHNRAFRAAFHVSPAGMVQMLDDRPLPRAIVEPLNDKVPWRPVRRAA